MIFLNVRAHVYIAGNVQGVFFRSKIAQEAHIHEIKGWVRNLQDGKVEAVFEGDEENVRKLIEFCRHGPPRATVTDVEVLWEEYKGKFDNFGIHY